MAATVLLTCAGFLAISVVFGFDFCAVFLACVHALVFGLLFFLFVGFVVSLVFVFTL